ncbi:helix-turn-helix domain-containing protein [Kutzneria sp. NPDC052558]|uniref:helix-turn-helix domain-containing protein n=1 Tax=Kutzneria sp. NPDC052558 TaxID=3364121 RepID=UPI0037CC1AC9
MLTGRITVPRNPISREEFHRMLPTERAPDLAATGVDEHGKPANYAVATAEQFEAQVREVIAILRDAFASDKDDPDRLFTAEELGALFQLSPRTLKDQAAAGVIAHHRFGKHYRFSRSDITEILRGAQQASRPPKRSWRAA